MYGRGMLDETTFAAAAAELCEADPDLAAIVELHGLPEFWAREPGLPDARPPHPRATGLACVGAGRLWPHGDEARRAPTAGILASTDAELRADGFSRQKARYVRALAGALADGSLDLDVVASLGDDAARSALVTLPGIGPWTAEVYLLSALRRPDTWPVGDIALQEAARRARGLDARPSPVELEAIGEAWRPNRATAARILWHLDRATLGLSDALRRDSRRRQVGDADRGGDGEPGETKDGGAAEARGEQRRRDADADGERRPRGEIAGPPDAPCDEAQARERDNAATTRRAAVGRLSGSTSATAPTAIPARAVHSPTAAPRP